MNRHVNAIAGRLSLRPPQRRFAGNSRPHHGDRPADKDDATLTLHWRPFGASFRR